MTERVAYIDFLPDNAAEALATYPAMSSRCADCAYTNGTAANRDSITIALAADCTKSRCAFWCHKTGDSEFKTHLCAGWIESLAPVAEPESR